MGDLGAHIEAVARKLLGEPNPHQSTRSQLRYGAHGSLAVEIAGEKRGEWYDHEAKIGGGVLDLLREKGGLTNGAALDWLRDMGIETKSEATVSGKWKFVADYHYRDETGAVRFRVCRWLKPDGTKTFSQERADGKGRWVKGKGAMKGAILVPYHLPDLIAAVGRKVILIPEGEKDVDALRRLGFAATCNPGGAGKWPAGFAKHFRGADVVVLADNDETGRKHAAEVAANLRPVARRVRLLDMPKGTPEKGDISWWIGRGTTADQIGAMLETAPDWVDPVKAAPEAVAIEANEDAIALEFAKRHADELRYCHDWGLWLQWDGARWQRERRRLAFHFAREVARDANREGKAGPAKASTAAGVERFAQADPRLATVGDEWDVDPWKLGTPSGTVNLRTGELTAARPADYITKTVAVTPADPKCGDGCPLWLDFLRQATRGDEELIRFLQQIAGYCLTGDVREHALFFIYGPGGNGKGVFLNTITKVMGDYATTAAMDTFTASHSDKHPTDLAKLRGARMVTASETEEGRAWAESRIKQITGGDRISARFMRQDFFEFDPAFKLVIVGNHKPILRNVDDAAKRRFNIIPFTHEPEERDLQLEEKLRAEFPAILRWMIEGCLDWQRNGLIRPKVVTDATAEYFSSQDMFGQWLEECCELHPGNDRRLETAADLFASWEAFCEMHGEEAGNSKTLGDKLSQRGAGLVRKRHPMNGKTCVMRTGISLVRPPQQWGNDD